MKCVFANKLKYRKFGGFYGNSFFVRRYCQADGIDDLVSSLSKSVEKFGEKPLFFSRDAINQKWDIVTYKQFETNVRKFKTVLRKMGKKQITVFFSFLASKLIGIFLIFFINFYDERTEASGQSVDHKQQQSGVGCGSLRNVFAWRSLCANVRGTEEFRVEVHPREQWGQGPASGQSQDIRDSGHTEVFPAESGSCALF